MCTFSSVLRDFFSIIAILFVVIGCIILYTMREISKKRCGKWLTEKRHKKHMKEIRKDVMIITMMGILQTILVTKMTMMINKRENF